MDKSYQGHVWKTLTKYENQAFVDCDFTGAIFDNSAFKHVSFKNCLFAGGSMHHIGVWASNFMDCKFIGLDLRNFPFGAQGGLFERCLFEQCDLHRQNFWRPLFRDCVFEKCKLKNINFNDASFHRCKFIGKLEDVTFNGMYHEEESELKPKPLDYVDFSEATFGEFVGFDSCDLSTCIPPNGAVFEKILYRVDLNDPNHLSTGDKDKSVIPLKLK